MGQQFESVDNFERRPRRPCRSRSQGSAEARPNRAAKEQSTRVLAEGPARSCRRETRSRPPSVEVWPNRAAKEREHTRPSRDPTLDTGAPFYDVHERSDGKRRGAGASQSRAGNWRRSWPVRSATAHLRHGTYRGRPRPPLPGTSYRHSRPAAPRRGHRGRPVTPAVYAANCCSPGVRHVRRGPEPVCQSVAQGIGTNALRVHRLRDAISYLASPRLMTGAWEGLLGGVPAAVVLVVVVRPTSCGGPRTVPARAAPMAVKKAAVTGVSLLGQRRPAADREQHLCPAHGHEEGGGRWRLPA
jgi:hypothetical protein